MKKLLFIPILVFGFAAVEVGARRGGAPIEDAPVAETEKGPRIAFDEKTIDFGAVAHGTAVKRAFRFRNVGSEDLVLTGVRTSCGCTAALPNRRRIPPGESGEIVVEFDTARKPSTKERTKYTNLVFVTSNDRGEHDSGAGVSKLTLEGEVVSRFRMIPDSGALLRGYRGAREAPASATVTVVPLGEARLEGASLVSAPPWLEVDSVRPVARGGLRGVEVVASLKPGLPLGRNAGSIVLKTGDLEQPEIAIPVQAHVLPPVQAVPARIVAMSGQAPRPISLIARAAVKVVAVEVVPDGGGAPPFAVARVPSDPVQRASIVLEAAKGVKPGAVSTGAVRIFLADADTPMIEVPYVLREAEAARGDAARQREAGVTVQPSEIYFGDVRAGTEQEESVHVVALGNAGLDLRAATVEPAGALEARVEPIAPGRSARIVVRAHASRPGGISGEVRFAPRPGAPELKVPVFGRVVSPVEVTPGAAYVGAGGATRITISRTDGRLPRVVSAEDPSGHLEAEIPPAGSVEAAKAGGASVVTVCVRPKAAAPRGSFRAEIVVRLDDPDAPEVRVPVFGEIW